MAGAKSLERIFSWQIGFDRCGCLVCGLNARRQCRLAQTFAWFVLWLGTQHLSSHESNVANHLKPITFCIIYIYTFINCKNIELYIYIFNYIYIYTTIYVYGYIYTTIYLHNYIYDYIYMTI